jgi:hypothetical protein
MRLIPLLSLIGALPAYGAAKTYTIVFTNTQGSPTPTGSFNYDPTLTNSFSNFFVMWDGFTLDLTGSANSGFINTTFPFTAPPPCLGNTQGAAASYALLTACSATGFWVAESVTQIGPSAFDLELSRPDGFPWIFVGCGEFIPRNFFGCPSVGGIRAGGGTYQVQGVATPAVPIYIGDTDNGRVRMVNTTGIITTVAGDGGWGYSGDGGPATSASLNNLQGVAVDAHGNIYIADTSDNRIRKVTASSGIITTVAGGGTVLGDGGLATLAGLTSPVGVGLDASGNIYIAGGNRIRKVTAATGNITTVAGTGASGSGGDGGAATNAGLNGPRGVAVDISGNFYIADAYNNRIRKVTASTGVITTVAGNGTAGFTGDNGPATSAELANPSGVAVDSAGNIYIADYSNNRIRKVTASTGIITTVAGNGTASYFGDGGPATSAALNYPAGVAVDSLGNIYIADYYNNSIREVIASSGIIVTAAGNGTPGYGGDGGASPGAELHLPTSVAVGPLPTP